MLLIYVDNVTSRVEYIFDLILNNIAKTDYSLTSDIGKFLEYKGPKFAYGKQLSPDTLYFGAVSLLFERHVAPQRVGLSEMDGLKILFPVAGGVLPFDPFAASFYMVSRYEEYLPAMKDQHDRFLSSQSIATQGNFLHLPIVHLWVEELKKVLLKRFPAISFLPRKYTVTPTIDIDNAYAYKYKGFLRTTFHLLYLLSCFQFKRFSKRIKVMAGVAPDPYDSYEKQENIHKKYKITPRYFFLLGDYTRYDTNISHKNKALIALINRIRQSAEVGIHPSYASYGKSHQLTKEKSRLETILGNKVLKSRQHFIRLKLPDTYRLLIDTGIQEDFSMGYPEKTGFRAGVCVPFHFYDLEKEEKTGLLIHPFIAMDVTLKKYMKLRSKEIIPFLTPYVAQVCTVGGDFNFIFHNESIGGAKMWKNWGDMYEKVIKLALNES